MRIKAALLAMGLVSCGLAQAALTSGTYVTEGKGNNGPVVVETTIENGAITKIRVLKNSETPMIGETAIKLLPTKSLTVSLWTLIKSPAPPTAATLF